MARRTATRRSESDREKVESAGEAKTPLKAISAEEWLTTAHVSALCGLNHTTLTRMARQARGPRHFDFDGIIRYRRQDVLDWIRRSERAPHKQKSSTTDDHDSSNSAI